MAKEITTDTYEYEPTSVMERQEMAYKMRLFGKSMKEICDELPYEDKDDVERDLLKRFEWESTFVTSQGRESLLQLQIARLELLLTGAMPAAVMGDPASTNAALKIIQEISKHAQLYEPDTQANQHTVLVVGGKEADYVEKLKAVLASD